MPATHYYSASKKGLVEIASMPVQHADSALQKLMRDRKDASRDDEIEGLRAHVAACTEEALEAQAIQPIEAEADDLGAGDIDLQPADDFAEAVAF